MFQYCSGMEEQCIFHALDAKVSTAEESAAEQKMKQEDTKIPDAQEQALCT